MASARKWAGLMTVLAVTTGAGVLAVVPAAGASIAYCVLRGNIGAAPAVECAVPAASMASCGQNVPAAATGAEGSLRNTQHAIRNQVEQGAPASDPAADITLTAELRAGTIDRILQELRDGYVFADIAKKMDGAVRERVARKEYETVTSGREMARKLTADLQAVSRDKHLRVVFNAQPATQPQRREPTPEEIAEREAFFRKDNYGFRRVERLPGNIGYVDFRLFANPEQAAKPLAAAMSFLGNTDALIFDLRSNGGGSPEMVALVCSYLFDKKVHLNSLVFRRGDEEEKIDFYTRETVEGPRFLEKPVYVLTSGRTFSGAEEFAYNLKTQKRATLVGERTGGGANPGGVMRVNAHFAVFVPRGRALNPITKTNWEGTGVEPDVAVSADGALEKAQQLAVEAVLGRAKSEAEKQAIRREVEANR